MNAALVINDLDDPRIKNIADWWCGSVNESCSDLFLVSGSGTNWCTLDGNGNQSRPLNLEGRPVFLDCVFVHGSDFDGSIQSLKKQISSGWRAGFIFNGPGNPPCKDGFIRILRSTAPFALTLRHYEEIVGFINQKSRGVEQPAPLPSCCQERAKHLVALDILAQGFLFTHGLLEAGDVSRTSDEKLWNRRLKKTEEMDWWLRGLKVESMDMLKAELVQDEVAEANAKNVVKLVEAALKPPLPSGKNTPHPLKILREEIAGLLQ
jgi:hypothetical protein